MKISDAKKLSLASRMSIANLSKDYLKVAMHLQ